MRHFATVENMRHFLHNRITHNVPTSLKEPRVKPIRARGLKRLKGPETRLNFRNGQWDHPGFAPPNQRDLGHKREHSTCRKRGGM
jgi:hypothetical protein